MHGLINRVPVQCSGARDGRFAVCRRADSRGLWLMSAAGKRFAPAAIVAALLFAALPKAALAHTGAPPTPGTIWRSWSFDPFVLLGLLLAAGCYLRGVRTLWARAGHGRGIAAWRTAAFAAGLAAVFVALITPLDALSAALFSGHMSQHLLLIAVAAPLLMLGEPGTAFLWAFSKPFRQQLGRWWKRSSRLRRLTRLLTRPLAAWTLSIAALWLWHAPALYQAALRSEPLHVLEHLCFLGSASLFWWTVLERAGQGRGHGPAILYILGLAVQGSLLGALMTFSSTPWYPHYAGTESAWGISALNDQQIAGLIMWVPAGVIYLLAAGLLFIAWIEGAERAQERSERRLHENPAP